MNGSLASEYLQITRFAGSSAEIASSESITGSVEDPVGVKSSRAGSGTGSSSTGSPAASDFSVPGCKSGITTGSPGSETGVAARSGSSAGGGANGRLLRVVRVGSVIGPAGLRGAAGCPILGNLDGSSRGIDDLAVFDESSREFAVGIDVATDAVVGRLTFGRLA